MALIEKSNLTEKQRRFVLAYLTSLNARDAAISAGYSKRSADRAANDLIRNPDVSAVIAHARRAAVKMAGTTTERALSEICAIAYSDIRSAFNELGQLIPPHQWPDSLAAAVSSIKVTTRRAPGGEPDDIEYVTEIKLWDKNKALEQLGRHLDLFKDGNLTVNVNIGDRIAKARARAQPPALPALSEQPINLDVPGALDIVPEHVELGPIKD